MKYERMARENHVPANVGGICPVKLLNELFESPEDLKRIHR